MAKTKYAADGKTPLTKVRKSLEWVQAQILAEPKRYNQGTYGPWRRQCMDCGVIGCIGGYLDVRRNGLEKHMRRRSGGPIITEALKELGLKPDRWRTTPWLFDQDLYAHFGKEPVTERGRARLAVRAIKDYLKEIGA